MKNTISARVADFLKNYPPFNEIPLNDLEVLSEQVSILYKSKEDVVFTENEKAHEYFYVVHKGAVALTNKEKADFLDLCDEGDIFGLRPLMANEDYKIGAKAYEECILYAIPIIEFKPFIKKNEEVANFLMESFASNTRNPYSIRNKGQFFQDSKEINPFRSH